MRKEKTARVRMLAADGAAAVILLALDQITKHLAILHLKDRPPFVVIDGVLEFQYLENTGSAFSLFRDQKIFILLMGFLVMAVLLFVLFRLPVKKRFLPAHILLSALIAGALGNIVDRVRFGFVVDFISFVLIHFPVFNAADCYIVVCTICIFLLFLFYYQEEELDFLNFHKKTD